MPPIQRNFDDRAWMCRALTLGRTMRGHAWPNPPVGCVVVRDGALLAEAATQPGGRPHAERKALDIAGVKAQGATLYVTLEPCCHWGKTPPCADAITKAGVSRVVSAVQDPDPRVNGGGFAKLRDAGVIVDVGLCADEATQLMSGFFHRIRHGVPEVVVLEGTSTYQPADTDALLVTEQHRVSLFARGAEIELAAVEPDLLLARLGEIGLTSVAVSKNDPLMAALTATNGVETNKPAATEAFVAATCQS